MKVKLLNCFEEWNEFEIGELANINLIIVNIISGDETIDVYYKDGSKETYDSDDHNRTMDFFDISYVLYQPGVVNKLEDNQWKDRDYQYYM